MVENDTLRARLAELEVSLAGRRSTDKGGLSDSDVAERRRFEAALKASEVRYRRLFESAKDGILILDGDTGRTIDANPFLLELLEYSHSELLGKRLWEIGAFRDIAANRSAFSKLQEEEYIRYENLPLETKGHQHRHVEFISNVYRETGVRRSFTGGPATASLWWTIAEIQCWWGSGTQSSVSWARKNRKNGSGSELKFLGSYPTFL